MLLFVYWSQHFPKISEMLTQQSMVSVLLLSYHKPSTCSCFYMYFMHNNWSIWVHHILLKFGTYMYIIIHAHLYTHWVFGMSGRKYTKRAMLVSACKPMCIIKSAMCRLNYMYMKLHSSSKLLVWWGREGFLQPERKHKQPYRHVALGCDFSIVFQGC